MPGKGNGKRKGFQRWQQADEATLAAIEKARPEVYANAVDDPNLCYDVSRFRMSTFLAEYNRNIDHRTAAKRAGIPIKTVRKWRKTNPWFAHQLNRVIATHEAMDQWQHIFDEMDRRMAAGEDVEAEYKKVLLDFRAEIYAQMSRHQKQKRDLDERYITPEKYRARPWNHW